MNIHLQEQDVDREALKQALVVGLVVPDSERALSYIVQEDWFHNRILHLAESQHAQEGLLDDQFLNIIVDLIKLGLNKLVPSKSERVALLFPALGFGGRVKGVGEVPAIDWLALITDRKDVMEPIYAWMRKLAADESALKAWGAAVAGLVNGRPEEPFGTGREGDPFLFALTSLSGFGRLYLSLAVVEDKNGQAYLLPGLVFDADAIDLKKA